MRVVTVIQDTTTGNKLYYPEILYKLLQTQGNIITKQRRLKVSDMDDSDHNISNTGTPDLQL